MKNFMLGFLTCLVIAIVVVIIFIWPPELSFIFNGFFWLSLFMFAAAIVLVGYLYINGSSSQGVYFFFAILLILCSSIMFFSFEQVAINNKFWEISMYKKYPTIFSLLIQFTSYAKNIVAFGFAAIGASIAENIITHRFYK